MAYLSRDKITGHVVFNICARENDVVNSIRESDINIHPVIRGVDRISSSGNISKYCMDTGFISIKPRDYKAFTEIFNSKIDYTLSCWIYTEDSNRTDLFFNKLSDNHSTIMFGKSIRGGCGGIGSGDYTYICVYNVSSRDDKMYYGTVEDNARVVGTWFHIAEVKKDDTLYFFQNGKLLNKFQMNTSQLKYVFDDTGIYFTLSKSSRYSSAPLNFLANDVVLLSGQALWTSDFDLPTEPLLGDFQEKEQIIFPHNIDDQNNMKVNY